MQGIKGPLKSSIKINDGFANLSIVILKPAPDEKL
jgi:hypothetical protein